MKPRVYWTYYPKSGRGFWRVSSRPNANGHVLLNWAKAHHVITTINAKVGAAIEYRKEYARQMRLRATT